MGNTTWPAWLAIAIGSGLGGVLRHAVTETVTRLAGGGFPLGTLTVNVLGSLVIGGCAALSSVAGHASWTPTVRHAVTTGLLGGFTTFSTFSVQTMALAQQGLWLAAGANAITSVVLGVAACATGYSAVLMLLRHG